LRPHDRFSSWRLLDRRRARKGGRVAERKSCPRDMLLEHEPLSLGIYAERDLMNSSNGERPCMLLVRGLRAGVKERDLPLHGVPSDS